MLMEFARGDSYERGFILKNKKTGQPITTAYDDVFFTVKKYYTESEVKLQKKLSDGGITYDGDGHYTVIIRPEDTDSLAFGEYDFDIEFAKGGTYRRTFVGKLKLLKEVTFRSNE